MWNCEAVRIWYEYFERFKIDCLKCDTPIEIYQKKKDVIINDIPGALKNKHMNGI